MSTATAERPMGADVAGGLEDYTCRELDDGTVIEFEFAPVGFLTKKGEPRKKDWRAYFVQGPDDEKRERRVSVTTLLDAITSKGGLAYWSEGGGIKGAQIAHTEGLLTASDSPEHAVEVVRQHQLGAEGEKNRAADRGLNVHGLLEHYMETGKAPNPSQHPEPHRGYIRALVRFLMKHDPEPIAIEQIVAAPEYAGRMDLVCTEGDGMTVSMDLKTQERCQIYSTAHVQLALYNRAHRLCGGVELDRSHVVALAADGEFRSMPLALDEDGAMKALAWYAAISPVESSCESMNRQEKKARA